MSYIIGIDTGGTFTDLVLVDDKGPVTTAKALTTPPTFTRGIFSALEDASESRRSSVDGILWETEVFKMRTLGGTCKTRL